MVNLTLKDISLYSFILLLLSIYLLTTPKTYLDPFHTGEYFVTAVNMSYEKVSYTIHGLVNYIPALISKSIFGDGFYIEATTYFIRLISLFASCVLTLICFNLLKGYKYKGVLLLFIFTLSLDVVSHRDLFMMLSIYAYAGVLFTPSNNPIRFTLQQLLFGFCMAVSLFWTFDRGLAVIISIGVGYIYYLFKSQDYKYLISIVTFVISIIVFSSASEMTSIHHYFENILSLIKSSAQWQYETSFEVGLFIVLAVLVWVVIVVGAASSIFKLDQHQDVSFSIFILIFSIFIFKASINRADLSHILINLMPLSLMVSFNVSKYQRVLPVEGGNLHIAKYSKFYFLLAGLLLLLGVALKSSGLIALSCIYLFFMSDRRKPFSAKLVVFFIILVSLYSMRLGYKQVKVYETGVIASPGNKWVSEVLKRNNTSCVFDLTNNGVINALVNLPTCTKYSYPVYTPFEDEKLMLEQLADSSPNTLVYSSGFWSYSIDGISMKKRYPEVNAFIEDTYPYERCSFNYCVKSLIDFN